MQADSAEISCIITLIREGKREGFNLLYAKYAGPLYGLLYRIVGNKSVAENLLEVTFVNICKRINQYDNTITFFTWMLHITQSVCREYTESGGIQKSEDAFGMIFLGRYNCKDAAEKMNTNIDIVKKDVRNKLRSFRQSI